MNTTSNKRDGWSWWYLLFVIQLTPLFNAMSAHRGGADETVPADYDA